MLYVCDVVCLSGPSDKPAHIEKKPYSFPLLHYIKVFFLSHSSNGTIKWKCTISRLHEYFPHLSAIARIMKANFHSREMTKIMKFNFHFDGWKFRNWWFWQGNIGLALAAKVSVSCPESYLNILKQSKEILIIAQKNKNMFYLHYLKFEMRLGD